MPTTRGTITSHTRPSDPDDDPIVRKVKESRPVKRPKTEIDPDNPLKGLTRFVPSGGVRNLTVKIAYLRDGDDPHDDELTTAVLAFLGKDRIKMRDKAFVTQDPPVIDWLRYRINTDRLPSVEEDYAMHDIACPHPGCEFTVKNTKAGHKALARHAFSEHRDEAS